MPRWTRRYRALVVERAEPINLGFSVADAEYPDLLLSRQRLTIRFTDWRDQNVEVVFKDVIALRWQEAEHYVDDQDRFDATVEVHESNWLAEHERQRVPWQGANFRHLKLNFNAAGILEILCTEAELSGGSAALQAE